MIYVIVSIYVDIYIYIYICIYRCERRVFIFVYISLVGTVIPFISFYRVPVFSEERINGPFLALSLFIFF